MKWSGDEARDEAGELSERRPEVKRGEYWANMAAEVVEVVGAVAVDDDGEEGECREWPTAGVGGYIDGRR